jgi:glycosyltransferase involved in cell wall biosynthesis
MIVGPDEEGMREHVLHTMRDAAARVTFVDYTPRPESFMAAADIFLLPSHREGFGATVIEAAACGTPTIGTSIYGLTDAVADSQTGILVPVRDASALADAIVRLTADPELRRTMGACARQRVECRFTEAHLTAAFQHYYEQFLGPRPAAS